jgi:hypothetical protein
MATIEAFLGALNFETIIDNITNMFRLAIMGKMLKQFVAQIKAMLMDIIVRIRAAIAEFKTIDLAAAIDDVVEQVTAILRNVGDFIKQLMSKTSSSG